MTKNIFVAGHMGMVECNVVHQAWQAGVQKLLFLGSSCIYQGRIEYDSSKPDGAPRKLMDNSKLKNLGWTPRFSLRDGLEDAYRWFADNIDNARGTGEDSTQ